MNWITSELLFYGGIAVSAGAAAAAVLYFSISKVKRIQLNVKLDAEYGKKNE